MARRGACSGTTTNPGTRVLSDSSTHGGCLQRRRIQSRRSAWVALQSDAAGKGSAISPHDPHTRQLCMAKPQEPLEHAGPAVDRCHVHAAEEQHVAFVPRFTRQRRPVLRAARHARAVEPERHLDDAVVVGSPRSLLRTARFSSSCSRRSSTTRGRTGRSAPGSRRPPRGGVSPAGRRGRARRGGAGGSASSSPATYRTAARQRASRAGNSRNTAPASGRVGAASCRAVNSAREAAGSLPYRACAMRSSGS
jgi:hypothetical protein